MSNVHSREASSERSELELLAERYVQLHREGKNPNIEDFVKGSPELEHDIRELFPVMLMLDKGRSNGSHIALGHHADLNIGAIGPGSRLGDYALIRPIGQGGMGVVYEAEHITLRSRVAIKLLPQSLNRPKLRERFLREASAAAKMNHPNIVRVFGYGSEGASHFYAMSLIEGVPLSQLLSTCVGQAPTQRLANRSRPSASAHTDGLSASSTVHDESTATQSTPSRADSKSLWQWVAKIGLQASSALAYAHELGVVHRDVKPSNLMLDVNDKLFVTDFGLAKLTDDSSLTETGDLLGTLRYMPPEALEGKADERSDIYGLGLTLYELLAGEPAFKSGEHAKLFHDISTGAIVPLAKRVPYIPRDLAQIVNKSIEPDPALRYPAAEVMRDDLQRFLVGEPILARSASYLYRSQRWIARNRVVSGLAASLFVLLAVATLIAGVSASRFRNLAKEKAGETAAAVAARNASAAQTRIAKLRLLDSHLSDAQASTAVAELGRALTGISALRSAIQLSRELGVFEEHQSEINSIAAVLSTKPDLQPELKWRNPGVFDRYGPLDFNGDLTQFAYVDESAEDPVCIVTQINRGASEILENIPLEGFPVVEGFRMSRDGRVLADLIEIDDGNSSYVRPWIYDRETKKSVYLERTERAGLFGYSMAIFNHSPRVAYLNAKRDLVIFDVARQSEEKRFSVPGVEGTDIALSPDDRRIAVFQDVTSNISIIDVETGQVEKLEFIRKAGDITAVAWRPDGRQLAIATKREMRIWDLAFNRSIQWFDHPCVHVTELEYLGDRLLAASGWKHTTHFFDPIGQRKIFRCENFLAGCSYDGQKIVLHGDDSFEIRTLHRSSVLTRFALGSKTRDPHTGIDIRSGTLWVGMPHKFTALDFVGNRNAFSEYREGKVAVDPLGRDVFVSANGLVFRIPAQDLAGAEADSATSDGRTLRFGPQEVTLSPAPGLKFRAESLHLSADGERLALNNELGRCEIVLDRQSNWEVSAHRHAEATHPIRVAPHPTRPLVATSSHHSPHIEVRNVVTNTVLLRIPGRQLNSQFSSDGSKLVVSGQGMLRTFDTTNWKLLKQTNGLELAEESAVSFDGRWIQAELLNPRGLVFIDLESLEPRLFIPGDSLDPESTPGCFGPRGRFVAADRGQTTIGVWDMFKLKQFFESLELEWPLPGLGDPVPTRDPDVDVEVLWNSRRMLQRREYSLEYEAKETPIGRWGEDWLLVPNRYLVELHEMESEFGDATGMGPLLTQTVHRLHRQWLPPLSTGAALTTIASAISEGSRAYGSGRADVCARIYKHLLTVLQSREIDGFGEETLALISRLSPTPSKLQTTRP